jgi:hypothetical protein
VCLVCCSTDDINKTKSLLFVVYIIYKNKYLIEKYNDYLSLGSYIH